MTPRQVDNLASPLTLQPGTALSVEVVDLVNPAESPAIADCQVSGTSRAWNEMCIGDDVGTCAADPGHTEQLGLSNIGEVLAEVLRST